MRFRMFVTLGMLPLLFAAALTFHSARATATPPADEGESSDVDHDDLRTLLRNHPTWRAIDLVAEVNSVSDGANVMPDVKVGDLMTATYVYDLAAGDEEIDPANGQYNFSQAPFGVMMRVGNHRLQTDPNNVAFNMQVLDDFYGADQFGFASYVNISKRPLKKHGYIGTADLIFMDLEDFTATAQSSDQLPSGPPDLDSFPSINLLGFYGHSENRETGDFQDLTIFATVVWAESVVP